LMLIEDGHQVACHLVHARVHPFLRSSTGINSPS
jgi:hypothetical protein